MVKERIGVRTTSRRSHSSGWRTVLSRKGLKIRVKTTVKDILTIQEVQDR